MVFTSISFALFLPVVFVLYWLVFRRLRWQNAFVLAASYVFYGWWDWRFLLLIALTSATSYAAGRLISRGRGRRVWLWANVLLNLGILGLFKYYDFFAAELAGLLGVSADPLLLHLVLPVGISFYTFQAVGYTVDVYKGRVEAERDAVAFFAYVAFFPQLVAGPIERARNLLPQFGAARRFDYGQAVDGARQILWGLFKKMVVADNCAVWVDLCFGEPAGGWARVLGAVLFTFQIYGDFSGYSDIAIGTAKLFGFRLMQNFRVPYFSRDIAEFWRRWHISLTTWFRDYLYIPLGGSRGTRWQTVRNTFIIFLASGLWHGANWTFLLWGFYHACLFLPLILLGRNRRHTGTVAEGRVLPSLREAGQMLLTFALAAFGWIIFRATGVPSLVAYLKSLVATTDFNHLMDKAQQLYIAAAGIVLMLVAEWFGRTAEHPLQGAGRWLRRRWLRLAAYAVGFFLVLWFRGSSTEFIYFQF